jgi:hypothetical protein
MFSNYIKKHFLQLICQYLILISRFDAGFLNNFYKYDHN